MRTRMCSLIWSAYVLVHCSCCPCVGVQALAAVCRHVAVEVVTAAERDSPDVQPSTGPGEAATTEQDNPSEQAHLGRSDWDAKPANASCYGGSMPQLDTSFSGHGCERLYQPSPTGRHWPKILALEPAGHAASEAMSADAVSSSTPEQHNIAQHATVRMRHGSEDPLACRPSITGSWLCTGVRVARDENLA